MLLALDGDIRAVPAARRLSDLNFQAFLILGSFILGERKWHIMLPVAFIATGVGLVSGSGSPWHLHAPPAGHFRRLTCLKDF